MLEKTKLLLAAQYHKQKIAWLIILGLILSSTSRLLYDVLLGPV